MQPESTTKFSSLQRTSFSPPTRSKSKPAQSWRTSSSMMWSSWAWQPEQGAMETSTAASCPFIDSWWLMNLRHNNLNVTKPWFWTSLSRSQIPARSHSGFGWKRCVSTSWEWVLVSNWLRNVCSIGKTHLSWCKFLRFSLKHGDFLSRSTSCPAGVLIHQIEHALYTVGPCHWSKWLANLTSWSFHKP